MVGSLESLIRAAADSAMYFNRGDQDQSNRGDGFFASYGQAGWQTGQGMQAEREEPRMFSNQKPGMVNVRDRFLDSHRKQEMAQRVAAMRKVIEKDHDLGTLRMTRNHLPGSGERETREPHVGLWRL